MVFAFRVDQVWCPMQRYCSKRRFRYIILCESICSFHQLGVEVPIVLQILPQMFNVTPI